MRIYCRFGERNQATTQYRRCQETVQEELNMAASDKTKALYRSIVSGDFIVDVVRRIYSPGELIWSVPATALFMP
jgi:DNA-binding SARP family transcriptional activator